MSGRAGRPSGGRPEAEDAAPPAGEPPPTSHGDHARAPTSDGPTSDGPLIDRPATSDHDPGGLHLARTIAGAVGKQARRRRAPARRPRVEPQVSGAHPDERDPALLSTALERLVESRGWSTEISVHSLLGRWPALVGSANAAHSRPEAYADGVLTLRADSTAWATQLRTMAPQLVARLNAELGQQTVTRVVVLGPDAPTWKRSPRSVRGRGPRDTYG